MVCSAITDHSPSVKIIIILYPQNTPAVETRRPDGPRIDVSNTPPEAFLHMLCYAHNTPASNHCTMYEYDWP